MTIYSHSKLSTFEQCPLKFKFKYLDKIIPEIEKSIEAFLGSIVHESLEWLYNQKKEGITPNIDEFIVHFSHNWNENFNPNDYIIKKNELTPRDYYEMGIKFLLDYYIEYQPFDENTLETEKKIEIELEELQNHKLIGFIDRLVYNKEKDVYEIHDYKTGNKLPSQEKIDEDRQLALYSIAIKNSFGKEKKVCLIWHYLAFNKEIKIEVSDEKLLNLKKETIDLINKIESTKEFFPNKSPLCDWCEYKNICPAWKNVSEDEFRKIITLKQTYDEKINEIKKQYPTLSKYIKDNTP